MIKERFDRLKNRGVALATDIESAIKRHTRWAPIQVFVHDEFEELYPEDHVTRSGDLLLSLRLKLELKGLSPILVNELKNHLRPLDLEWIRLRPNFEDSWDSVDFDWHLLETENESIVKAKVLLDAERLYTEISKLIE